MGVHDLWRLLGPCGHRLSLNTLSRTRLAIDVSIWIQQFVKALPGDQPHLLGLLRRLCKLHFYHIRPVFVFDGPAPMIKKRTLEQRRRVREKQKEAIERVAERLVLEQLKMSSIKQLRRQIEQNNKKKQTAAEDKKQQQPQADAGKEEPIIDVDDNNDLDDPEQLLLHQLQAEENEGGPLDTQAILAKWQQQDAEFSHKSASRTASVPASSSSSSMSSSLSPPPDDNPLPIIDPHSYELPASGELDAHVLASLPISLQYTLLEQHRNHHHTLSLGQYARVKDDMSAFSAMQMNSFLKSVQFNKEIDRKRQELNAGHLRNGLTVKRIAGDGRKEYVYEKIPEPHYPVSTKQEEMIDHQQRGQDERDAESSTYLSSHRPHTQSSVIWYCDTCGLRNNEVENDISNLCSGCGSTRKKHEDAGGTLNILLGRYQQHSTKQKQSDIRQRSSSSGSNSSIESDTTLKTDAKTKSMVHMNDIDLTSDSESHPTNEPEPSQTNRSVPKQSGPIEISFDLSGADVGHKTASSAHDDLFPAEFFSSFDPFAVATDNPSASSSRTQSSLPAAVAPPSSSASLLLPASTIAVASKIRRPRLRLKKMDVKEIIWFDEEQQRQPTLTHSDQQTDFHRNEVDSTIISEDDSEPVEGSGSIVPDVEEVVIRGRVKQVPRHTISPAATRKRMVEMNAAFLEEEESKYDDTSDVDEQKSDAHQDRQEKQLSEDEEEELKRAILLSLSAARGAPEQLKSPADESIEIFGRPQISSDLLPSSPLDETVLSSSSSSSLESSSFPPTASSSIDRSVFASPTGSSESIEVSACNSSASQFTIPNFTDLSQSRSLLKQPNQFVANQPRSQDAVPTPAAQHSLSSTKVQLPPGDDIDVELIELKGPEMIDIDDHERQEPSNSSSSTSSSPPSSAAAPSIPAGQEALLVWSSGAEQEQDTTAESARLTAAYSESLSSSSSLSKQQQKQTRQSQQVTAEMFDECRHLLSLFGCPYVISPAEAEAQCAALEMLGLVEGVVTEDSDVFVFGAKTVYRNIFEAKKYAERYRYAEIEAKLGLTRAGMISLALLLGSDYTEGVHGIGIVNGMEIINAFDRDGNVGLREFRQWVYSGSVEQKPSIPILEPSPSDDEEENIVESDHDKQAREHRNTVLIHEYRKDLFKYRHRNIRSSWHVHRDFPSDQIRQQYEHPIIDDDTQPFSWAAPRWDDIIQFLRERFNHQHNHHQHRQQQDQSKVSLVSADGISNIHEEWLALVNTLRSSWEAEESNRQQETHHQTLLDAYFDPNDQFATLKSQRINLAIQQLTAGSTNKKQSILTETTEGANRNQFSSKRKVNAGQQQKNAQKKKKKKQQSSSSSSASSATDSDSDSVALVENTHPVAVLAPKRAPVKV